MVTPQLWNCQTGVSGCWCGRSRCCWLWKPHKEQWSQSLMTPCCGPTYSSHRQQPSTRPRPQRSRHAFHMCHLELHHSSSTSSSSTSQIPNKLRWLSFSKGKYYSPSLKTLQARFGLIRWSDTTFACELHNCYALQELKPLIRTTWCICHSIFEYERDTYIQSWSTLKHGGLVSTVCNISGHRRRSWSMCPNST